MSDSEKGGSSIGAHLPTIIVKGGTTSSRYDKDRAQREALAEQGRQHQDKQEQAASFGVGMTDKGFVHSKLTSLRMMDSGHPRVVFYYLNKDKTPRQECVGELVLSGDDELFVLVCPKCLERGEPHGSAQVMVKKSHRKWFLDTRTQDKKGEKAGDIVHLKDPNGQLFQVRICGTITCNDIIRCSNLGCNWAVQIDDSKVMEV